MRVYYNKRELEQVATDKSHQPKSMHRDVVRAYRKTIGLLTAATTRQDLAAMRGLRLEKLKGERRGQYSMRVNDQWRIIVVFQSDDAGEAARVLELVDYH